MRISTALKTLKDRIGHAFENGVAIMEYTVAAWKFGSEGLATPVVVVAILMCVLAPTALFKPRSERRQFLIDLSKSSFVALGLGVLGWVIGYMTGASRESAVSEVVPAVLGAVAAFAGFVTVKYGQALAIGMMIISFSSSIFVGATAGAKIRETHETLDRGLPSLEFMQNEAYKEMLIKEYRERLKLPWPPDDNPYFIDSDKHSSIKSNKDAGETEKPNNKIRDQIEKRQ
ncbi:hypothetical protein [Paraburkholderia youngii]|uniref:hypothetical protein n=1 Tax=Paraburkholderia youngii TaxID=2782701 RepID=UPI003D1C334E